MYIGNKHSETQRKALELAFRCRRCGHRDIALVTARGSGGGFSLMGLDGDGARTRASEAAEAAVRSDGLRSLRLVRCPSCRRFPSGALAGALLGLLVRVAALACVIAFVVFALSGSGAGSYIRIAGIALIAGYGLYELSRIASAKHRVRFGQRPGKH